jgi:tRNA-specific 2-thiouridylase
MKSIAQKTVFVGMSGGVDSSLTAALLKEQGYRVVGVHLRCWNVDGCAEQDAEDARRAAEVLGIPFYVFDFEKEYKERVVRYMVNGYKKGITPNPDVMCNQEIKFGLFYQRAISLGADYVATGHYVKLVRSRQGLSLFAAKDSTKDQSYFLWMLTPEQLEHCLFPLGDLIKRTQVRRLAKKYKLPNALKKDSQGICFLGAVSLPEFLADFIPVKTGDVLNLEGEVIGTHKGAQFYTIGQRRGLGVGGSATPLYVADKDIKRNTLVLAPESDQALYKRSVTLSDVNSISANVKFKPNTELAVYVRVRYRQPLIKARVVVAQTTELVFDKPQKFIAPGQSAVIYAKRPQGFQMIGGGVIVSAK